MRTKRLRLIFLCTLALTLECVTEGLAATEPEPGDPALLTELLVRAEAVARLAKSSPTVAIPAGQFLMGPAHPQNAPAASGMTEPQQRHIWLDAYAIDREEVSLGQYLAWVRQRPSSLPPNLADLETLKLLSHFADVLLSDDRPPDRVLAFWPAFSVTWFEAEAYCRTMGKRLPTEAEWEKAAGGVNGREYPWGHAAPDMGHAVFDRESDGNLPAVAAVDSRRAGRSPYGLHHMAGNVAEWVQDWAGSGSPVSPSERNPTGPAGGERKVLRGGSWRSAPSALRVTARENALPEQRSLAVGFRCAKSPAPPSKRR